MERTRRTFCPLHGCAGVQLVACSTPANSKALLKSAIRSDNPVVFFEARRPLRRRRRHEPPTSLRAPRPLAQHVLLYNVKGVTYEDYCQPLEVAELVRPGKDVTILTYSRMRYVVESAVKEVVAQGYDPEVIDLISLKPFDQHSISESVRKTHKVIIVEECMRSGGIGASVSSWISENLLDHLDHEVVRLSSQDVPTAYAKPLEDATIVQAKDVVRAVHKVVGAPALAAVGR